MKSEKVAGVRLNKYIANSGVCNRREADELIESGAIKINGKVVKQLGTLVNPEKDTVEYQGIALGGDVKKCVLLNKSKGYGIGGRDVTRLLVGASKDRLFPIGQLKSEETGLVLFSNDPDLPKKIKSSRDPHLFLYHISCNQALDADIELRLKNVSKRLEEKVSIGDVVVVEGTGGLDVGLMTNCSDTRVIHKLFKDVGATISKIDRVIYAGISKKDIPRGKWRMLSSKEIAFLQMV